MKKETKMIIADILTMLYQFIFCGILFWMMVYPSFRPTTILGQVITPLDSIGINLKLPMWFLIAIIFGIFGSIGFYIQRKIHLKFKRERETPSKRM